MKQRFLFLLRTYIAFIALFWATKLCFMIYNGLEANQASLSDYFSCVFYGLPHDLATAGYVTAFIWLVLLCSLWFKIPRLKLGFHIYIGILSVLLALILLADICLYEYWGIKLDGTVFNYLDNPRGVLASVSITYTITCTILWILYALAIYYLLHLQYPNEELPPCRSLAEKGGSTLAFILIGGLMFLGIRGGVGKSTANVGMVYYSQNTYLNHTAVNPVFSLFYSLSLSEDFEKMHDYFPEDKRQSLFQSLGYNTESLGVDTLLNNQRPNVLIILMEGCGATFVHAFDSLAHPDITPNLNKLAQESVIFTQCYANSFRTDRGNVCTLSGYPAFPDISVMKLPSKCEKLPSIARSLQQEGYLTEYLYGGDINFTNTNGYLLSIGYKNTYGDTSFTLEERKTHNWGVTDHITFNRLYDMVMSYPQDQPWHTVLMTLSSHEPWEVPYDRIKDNMVYNSMAYLDDCIGNFMTRFRQTPHWDNTLVVLLPDHGILLPDNLSDDNPRKSHIPMIWTGGAIKGPRKIDNICNQTDLAATLLGQMGLSHDDFRFSRDVLSTTYIHPSAVHAWPEGIYYMDYSGITALNLLTKPQKVIVDTPSPSLRRADAANAFLQTCYDDLGAL